MAKANICSGVCGFDTLVQAETDKEYQTKLQIESNCPNIKKLFEALQKTESLNATTELFKKGESKVLSLSQEVLPHVTCPVPTGILKAIELSAGMALPKDVSITLEK